MNFNRRSAPTLPSNFNMHSIRNVAPRQQQQQQQQQQRRPGGLSQQGAKIFGQQNQSYGPPNISSYGQSFSKYGVNSGRALAPSGPDYDSIRTVSTRPYQSISGRSDPWNTSGSQGDDFDDDMGIGGGRSQGIQSVMRSSHLGQTSRQQQQQQQMVMVVRPGDTGNGELMGTIQTSPGQFNLQQQPMQVILQGVNSDTFGQFGQGSNVMMGLMNQRHQQQPKPLFNERIMMEGGGRGGGGGRFSQRPSLIPRRGSGRLTTRRPDYFTSNSKNTSNRGRGSANISSTTFSSGDKKRIIRDRLGHPDEVQKRRRTSPPKGNQNNKNNPPAVAKGNQGKVGPPPGLGLGFDRTGRSNKQWRKRANKKMAAFGKNKNVEDDKTKEKVSDKKDGAETKSEEKKDEKTSGHTDEGKTEEEKLKEEEEIAKFNSIPATLLVCKICQTVQPDGAAFVNHLNGSDHVAMAKIMEKRFEERAKFLKSECSLLEDELSIKIKKERPTKRSNGNQSKNACSVCVCTYTINWIAHRNSIMHRIMKEYLSPTCRCCEKTFDCRIDWAGHLQSVGHLQKLAEMKESGKDVTDHESTVQDDLFAINVEMRKTEHPTPLFVIRSAGYRVPTKEDLRELLRDEKGEVFLPPGEIKMPGEYERGQAYGEEAISTVEGASCKVCRIFLENQAAVPAHIRGKAHYGMYVNYLKKVAELRKVEEQEKADTEAAAAAAVDVEKQEEEEEVKTEQEQEEEGTPMDTEDALVIDETSVDDKDDGQQQHEEKDDPADITDETGDVEESSTTVDTVVESESDDNVAAAADTEMKEEDEKEEEDKKEMAATEKKEVDISDSEKVEPETVEIIEPEVVVVEPKFKIPKLTTTGGKQTPVKAAPAAKPAVAKPALVKQAPVKAAPVRQTPATAAAPLKKPPPPPNIGQPKVQQQQAKK